MANFAVHLAGGFIATGLATACVQAAGLATAWEMLAYLALGTAGSLLPDLDSQHSKPTRIAFTVVALTSAFGVVFLLADQFPSIVEKVLIWLSVYLFLRVLLFPSLARLTTHRGLFHSIPAAALFGMFTAIVSTYLLRQAPLQAWLGGAFVTYGYLVHLLLDEFNSLDLAGRRVRRSLGTAFKLWVPRNPMGSVGLYLICAAAFGLMPDAQPLLERLASAQTYQRLGDQFLPASWRGLL